MKKMIVLALCQLLFLMSCKETDLGATPPTTIAGKSGDVILTTSDITGLGTAATLNAGTAANNLVKLDGSGLIPTALIPPSGAVTLSGDVTGAANATVVGRIATTPLTIASLTINDILRYNGTAWVNTPQTFNQFAGELIEFTGTSCPSGTVMGDGSVYNRAVEVDLYNAMGCSHGCPTGTTFNVIDLRGRFTRFQDQSTGRDPDVGTRAAANVGGATGDNVGSLQADMIVSHNHTQNAHGHSLRAGNNTPTGPASGRGFGAYDTFGSSLTNTLDGVPYIDTATATNNATGGNETRPKNIYVLPCIRRFNR